MPIVFECDCGRKLRVRDEAAGRAFNCPECGQEVVAPEGNVFVPASREGESIAGIRIDQDPPAGPAPRKKRPFWRDPIILIGGVFPAGVLIWFGSYLYIQKSRRETVAEIFRLRSEADRSFDADPEAAYQLYGRLILVAGDDPHNESARRSVAAAKKNRDFLWPKIRAKVEVKAAAERLAGEARARSEAARAENEKLASFRADVSGGCWVSRKMGDSLVLRGLSIDVVPAHLTRREICESVRDSRVDFLFDMVGPLNSQGTPPDELVPLPTMAAAFHGLVPREGNSAEVTYKACKEEPLWPRLLAARRVASAESDIEGRFSIKGLKGGKYLVCARHFSDVAFIEWIVPLQVDSTGAVALNLHNDNAAIIQNRFER